MLRPLWNRLFARSERKVRDAFVDPLTSLPTRHALQEHLRAAAREGGPGGIVAMADIDHFKLFNNAHGHTMGDELLRSVANQLRASLPDTAYLARIGGDEFVIHLPGANLAEGEYLVLAALGAVRNSTGVPGLPTPQATLSAGLATFTGLYVDEVLRATDIAMYAAKARGRDRLVVFGDETRHIATARRELASTVIELQRLNRKLYDEARTDALTGLRNRLALDEILDQTLGAEASPWASATVVFIDIDHFGDYNHLHGDASGDQALRDVAAAVRGCARDADLAFRKGGEEFAVVLPDTFGLAAEAAGERMRAAVEQLGIPHSGSSVAPVVTVTVGVASSLEACSIRQLLVAASNSAMAAKVDGRRNSVQAGTVQ